MKFSSVALALAASLPFASAVRNGFNIGANRADGSCKNEGDWEASFKQMKHIPGKFTHARVYASSDCNTLERAVPAAKRTGIKILVGVWTEDEAHYEAEKKALLKACHEHGTGWITAISVGSEDLYRGDTNAATLAGQVHDVRGMMTTVKGGRGIPIGHVDTWTAWVNPANVAVVKAVDFIGMDGYPYYQNAKISRAHKVFYKSLKATHKHSHGKPVWVTETAWPVHGPNSGKAHPSPKNARHYWKNTMCKLFKTHNTFAYTLKDYWIAPADPTFGVIGANGKHTYNLHC